jgi:hypothetical protein
MATAALRNISNSTGEFFAEFFAPSTRKLIVNRENFTVSGVKLMGTVSKNGRRFTESAMKNIFDLCENANVNLNHNTKDLGAPRDYRDRIAHVVSREIEAEGIYGTIQVNPKHPQAEQFLWDAENAPHKCGMSPVYAPGKTSRPRGENTLLVESVTKVSSIDIVGDPATTNSLKESQGETMSEQLLAEALAAKSTLEKQVETLNAQVGTLTGQNKTLAEQVESLTAAQAKADRKAAVSALIAEAKLPADAVLAETREMWESADAAVSEKAVKNFAEAFHRGNGKPKSDAPASGGKSGASGEFDAKAFAGRLKK